MKNDDLNIEEILYEDAQNIVIDEKFKNDLKSRFMSEQSSNNVINLPKRENKLYNNKYLKIASGFAICVLVGGTWIRVNNNIVKVNPTEKIMPFEEHEVPAKKEPSVSMGKETVKNPSGNQIALMNQESDKDPAKHIDKEPDEHIDKKPNEKHSPNNSKSIKSSQEAKGSTAIVGDKNKKGLDDHSPNTNNVITDLEISKRLNEENKNASVKINTKVPINNSKMEPTEEVQDCYDSRYSPSGDSVAIIKENVLYIKHLKTSEMKKLIEYNNENCVIDKPNFTQNGRLIYYKAEKVDIDGVSYKEKNSAIYITNLDGSSNEKLIDGSNPMISKDGQKLTYEIDGKIYIMNLNTNSKVYVDDGKYPAWSENGNMLSYVKESKEKQIYDKITEKKDVYIEKVYSTIWVYNVESGNKFNLGDKKIDIDNNNLESWANAVRNGKSTSNFDVHGKYTYYESLWGNNNKELFVLRLDNDVNVFELIKYNIGDI